MAAAIAGPDSGTGVDSESWEAEHVHQVYEHIAQHFSATRYKPWPVVERFLREQPRGSVGLDIGCGNGKYLPVNPDVFIVGSDRSSSLVRIARDRKVQDAFVADALDLPHPEARFDFAISIAVIHHLSSPERRVDAIRSILGVLRRPASGSTDSGRALIFVWALEQKTSRRGWDENNPQDIFVPWVMPKATEEKLGKGGQVKESNVSQSSDINAGARTEAKQSESSSPEQGTTYQRYYHLYRKGELDADVVAAGGKVFDSGYDRDNWWAICGPAE